MLHGDSKDGRPQMTDEQRAESQELFLSCARQMVAIEHLAEHISGRCDGQLGCTIRREHSPEKGRIDTKDGHR